MGKHILEFTIEDFADIFNTSVENLPDICKSVIKKSDFRYTVLFGAEREKVFTRVREAIDSNMLKTSGPHRKQDWEKGWSENLGNFLVSNCDTTKLIPKFVRQKEVIRFRDNYISPADPNFETNFVTVIRYYLFSKYFSGVSKVYEFGCGTGLNLLAVAQLFSQKELYGLDWSTASCTIVDELAGKFNLNLKSVLFDMFNPDESINVDNTSAVFTIGAMEQLGINFTPFIDFLLQKKPSICINIEAIYELHDINSLFGQLGAKFIEKRNYLCGYLDFLKELELQGRIEIVEIKKTFGGLYHDGYTYLVWRIKV